MRIRPTQFLPSPGKLVLPSKDIRKPSQRKQSLSNNLTPAHESPYSQKPSRRSRAAARTSKDHIALARTLTLRCHRTSSTEAQTSMQPGSEKISSGWEAEKAVSSKQKRRKSRSAKQTNAPNSCPIIFRASAQERQDTSEIPHRPPRRCCKQCWSE